MAKYGVLILGALVLVGALGYALFAPREEILPSSLSVQTETGARVSFKEYVSKELGFAISYPSTWSSIKETAGIKGGDYEAVVFSSPKVTGISDDVVMPNFGVNYYDSLSVLLAFEGIETSDMTLEGYLRASKVVSGLSPATLAGRPAWKAIVPRATELDVIDTVFVEHGGHIYALGVSNRTDFDPRVEEAVISSFKFIDDK